MQYYMQYWYNTIQGLKFYSMSSKVHLSETHWIVAAPVPDFSKKNLTVVKCIENVPLCLFNGSYLYFHYSNTAWARVIMRVYRQVSNISRTLVGNKIVDHSDVVGASPVGAAPTTSSFST